jgi:hypothetical protein
MEVTKEAPSAALYDAMLLFQCKIAATHPSIHHKKEIHLRLSLTGMKKGYQ